jgi:hypothetical protein
MSISGAQQTQAALAALQSGATQGADSKRAALQVMVLRKTLDSQQQQAAEMMKLLEGKGQQLDIRV